jgi:ABC-2 type transport system ATP-binding protein
MSDHQPPSLEARHLTKRYGDVTAIEDVSFELRRGQVVGFLGPNGAGKSTTIRILCGLMPASSGSVSVAGYEITRHPIEVMRRVGYLPENNPLPEDLTVKEYLKFRGRLKGLGGRRLRDRMNTVMDLCDLQRKARNRLIRKLSKGFRQRVGIADALLAEPEIVILDEPTIGLDPHQLKAVRNLLNQLRGQMTILLSSHILPEIEMCCDETLIINHGHIVARGRPADLKREFITERLYRIRIIGNIDDIRRCLVELDPEGSLQADAEGHEGDGLQLQWKTTSQDDLSGLFLSCLTKIEAFKLIEISRQNPSLEDVFMAATRRVWESITPLAEQETADNQV